MLRVSDRAKQEFLSKFIADLAKAIFAVALASRFFVELPGTLRIILGAGFITLTIIALIVQPPEQRKSI